MREKRMSLRDRAERLGVSIRPVLYSTLLQATSSRK